MSSPTMSNVFCHQKTTRCFGKLGLARNRLLFSTRGLVDKTQARTTLFRGSILEKSVTEENVGDCAVVLPPKNNKIFRESPNYLSSVEPKRMLPRALSWSSKVLSLGSSASTKVIVLSQNLPIALSSSRL